VRHSPGGPRDLRRVDGRVLIFARVNRRLPYYEHNDASRHLRPPSDVHHDARFTFLRGDYTFRAGIGDDPGQRGRLHFVHVRAGQAVQRLHLLRRVRELMAAGAVGRWVKAPAAGTGVDASLLGTKVRSGDPDDLVQITYNGWPLYLWHGDSQPGEASGQGLNDTGGLWYVLDPNGVPVTASP
jgi:Secreted repeat of unknown function